ncbi:hypothetical protein N7532_008217 [Penicillium argentinense]|uniref:Uncharacterized protein n=1 Tax=Penicillium argentinense TaxID=1131581 RepID=A0A9W9K1E4_9EURO|nr:uncharacterized protein N7532_008217 [Penicillium argentinense]KAJ5089533.1 hypothetical protein N7532_008217 [Penicillium argentinense]
MRANPDRPPASPWLISMQSEKGKAPTGSRVGTGPAPWTRSFRRRLLPSLSQDPAGLSRAAEYDVVREARSQRGQDGLGRILDGIDPLNGVTRRVDGKHQRAVHTVIAP